MDNGISTEVPRCYCCGNLIKRNPRLGDRPQHYCQKPACQRARKAKWHGLKYAANAVFREAAKKRVRINRRTRRDRKSNDVPAHGRGPPEAGPGGWRLQAQMTEVQLLLKGMASHTTGIVNGADLALCLERYTERGRMLQQSGPP
ncbi:MAG: hypothetical protein ACOYOU_14950 [Kiritimatiellia bacterium]